MSTLTVHRAGDSVPLDHADSAHNEEAEIEARVRFCENDKLTFDVTGMCAGLDTALTAWC